MAERASARASKSRSTRAVSVALGLATATGFAWILAGLWEAIGPFSVTIEGQSYGCGSPLLGRWFATGYDPAAVSASMCGAGAPERRLLTFLFAGIGVALLAVGVASAAIHDRRRRIPLSPGSSAGYDLLGSRGQLRHSLALDVLGIAAGVLLLAGAFFAVLHAA